MKTAKANKVYFVSPDGDQVTIRTNMASGRDVYSVFVGGWRVKVYNTKRGVRSFIMENELKQVEL
jgi:hypothetical protein